MTGYTKLFGSIVASTIWREPHETRIVWITMLALANKKGLVEASIPGLADLSRVTVKECEAALKVLSSSDAYSRTKDHEGRRIEAVDGGWFVLNHPKYRAKMNADERREYLRVKQQEYRELCQHGVNNRKQSSTLSTHAEAAPKADAEAKREGRVRFTPPSPEEVSLYGAKIGLPATVCERWLAHYEANGWKVGRNPMKSWQACMRFWKTDQHGVGASHNQARPMSVMDLKTVMQAKENEASSIKNRHCSKTAMSEVWDSQEAKKKYIALRVEMKQLNQKIAQLA